MKIAFISPYEELSELVKTVSDDMDVEIDVYTGIFDTGAKIARQLEKQNYDILISRGATFNNIIEAVNIPVINCEVNTIDILYSLNEALQISKKIGLIIYDQVPFDVQKMSAILGVELLHMTSYKNYDDLKKLIKDADQMGAEIIVGGVTSIDYAESIGMKGVLLKTSSETVRQAIKNALEVLNLSRRQMFQMERLNQILNFSYEGIIATDSDGVVTLFNPAAESILGIKANEIIGNKANMYIPTTGLIDVLDTGEPQLGVIQKNKNTTILTNRIPLLVKDSIQGVVATFQDISKIQDYEIKIRNEIYKKGLAVKYSLADYISLNENVKVMIAKAKMYAESDSTLLIHGESGTGKEILAQGIHHASKRKNFPFVAINCSAIPENLLESELFGYDEGAFTGAKKGGKMGMFELAHKGTIFLDEIGSMPMNIQSSLLRVLQEREVWRIGSNKVINVDVRVIAATNNDLYEAVELGEFRRDLYYRLNVLKINTIPLRDRENDLEILFDHFLKHNCQVRVPVNQKTKELMKNYIWPGNVRELENFAERVALLHKSIPIENIFLDFIQESNTQKTTITDDKNSIQIRKSTLEEMENEIIHKLYQEYGENATLLSERLNISRTTLWKKLKKENTKRS